MPPMLPAQDFLRSSREPRTESVRLTGHSAATELLRKQIEHVAPSSAKVLISGESGSGKEVVARLLHSLSTRASRVFEPVNCGGIPESLLEAELFGYVRGSFTGAYHDKPGKLETAHLGTLFLDEIGEMTPHMQTTLLRFLETGEIEKVGATGPGRRVDVRVVTATNRNLLDMVKDGTFREDLFYRLNVVHITVPPLRERRDDIPELLAEAALKFAEANGTERLFFTQAATAALMAYAWPGNVRQLENLVERLTVTCEHPTVDVENLPLFARAAVAGPNPEGQAHRTRADELYERIIEHHESFWEAVYPAFMSRDITREDVRDVVRRALVDARGNYRIVTRLLNIPPDEYKRLLNFLHQHDCHVPYKEYR